MRKDISKYGLTLLLALVGLILPGCIAVANGCESVMQGCAGIFFSLLLIAVVLLIPNKVGRWIGISVLLFFSLIEIIHTIVYYGDLSSAGYVRSLFMTTPHEADGALSVVVKQNIVYIILLSIYYIGVSVWVLLTQWSKNIGLKGFLITMILAVLTCLAEIIGGRTFPQIARSVPFNVYTQSFEAIRQVHERNKIIDYNEDFSYCAKRDLALVEKEIYVLVIDESVSYSHLSIGGYERETTPYLEKLSHLISYTDYNATAVFTMYSVPLLLTPATPNSFSSHYTMRGVQQAFKECGFACYWVTHIGQLVNDGVSDYVAEGVDEIISVNNDSDFPTIIDSLSQENDKLFIIAHLWGSHQHYTNASKTISRYTPNRLDSKDVRNKDVFINSYDNTILYTDSILGALTNVLKQRDAISLWMFVSDHGEGVIGKTSGAHGYTIPQETEYHVPFIIWYSDKYAAIFPQKVTHTIKHKDEPICADHVFWSVLDMAGVKIELNTMQYGMSIFGDALLPHKRQLLLPDGKTIMNLN